MGNIMAEDQQHTYGGWEAGGAPELGVWGQGLASLAGKVGIVTGASRGIGAATARTFAGFVRRSCWRPATRNPWSVAGKIQASGGRR